MPEKIGDNVLNWASMLEEVAREQALATASIAAINGHVALMPDAHWGMGCTIGSVIPTRTAIIPSAVGVDIGCGVIASKLNIETSQLPDDLTPVLNRWAQYIPAGLGYWHKESGGLWDTFLANNGEGSGRIDDLMLKRAGKQFGTLGSGNHFLELCSDEEGGVWLMLHSGSRGVGNKLAMMHISEAKDLMKRYFIDLPDPDLAYFVQDTPEFDAYIEDLNWAQTYAFHNRSAMMDAAVLAVQEVMSHDLGLPDLEIVAEETINNHHNYAQLEHHHGKDLWITRKGAIQAREGQLGVIPGSMGTGSYIVKGLGNPASYMSASHGAGRSMSRKQARKQFSPEDLEAAMEGKTWLQADAKALLDEIPGAYKDLDKVMADQDDLIEVVHHLTTLVNYKGVEKGNRRGKH